MFVDTHCHLNHADYAEDSLAVGERAQAAGVSRMLVIGYDRASSRRAAAMAAPNSGLYAAIGIHPEAAHEWGTEARMELGRLFRDGPGHVVAYGEIGLDYHWDTVPRERQQSVFAAQIACAQTLSPTLPLIIHNREAQEDILNILRDSRTNAPVIMHCFTGDTQAARACLDAGYYLGIGGIITFKKSDALRAALAAIPLERILLETDCPYLAPQPWRGRRNEPSYLPAVAQTIASVKGVPIETIAAVTTTTACALFGMRD